jgi:hypothetical protein
MKIKDVVASVRKYIEEYYLFFLAILLFVEAALDNPLVSKILEKTSWYKQWFGEQSLEETLMAATLLSITLGIYLNGRKLDDLHASVVSEAKTFGLYLPAVQKYQQRDESFSQIAEKVLVEQRRVIGRLAKGVFSVQLELMERMQEAFMEVFRDRMDAASYDDLELWRHIDRQAGHVADADGKVFDSDVGRKYYKKILDLKELHKTVVTRVLVLERGEAQDDIETVARVVKQHVDDGIGVALAFVENLHASTSEWFNTAELATDRPRRDFAIFDRERAVTFFRKNATPQRFEAVVNLDGWAELIGWQREAHKTLLVASVFATQHFYERIFKETSFKQGGRLRTIEPFYDQREAQDFRLVIDHIRSESLPAAGAAGESPNEWEQMFSVTLSDAEYGGRLTDEERLRLVKAKIEKSVAVSRKFRDNVYPFGKLLASARRDANRS